MNKLINVKGIFKGCLQKADGTVIRCEQNNMILDSGYAHLAACLINTKRPEFFSKIAIGINASQSLSTQSKLLDEIAVR